MGRRFLPGYEDEFFAEVDSLLGPGVRREFMIDDIALETMFDGDLCGGYDCCVAEDPGEGLSLSACPGGTDVKSFSLARLRASGSCCCGSGGPATSPACSTACSERAPVSALQFGTRVLDGFLDCC